METNGIHLFIVSAHGVNLMGDNCREKYRNLINSAREFTLTLN
jgi:hypothetical protein